MPKAISTAELVEAMTLPHPPQIIDVRRQPAFDASAHMISAATWRNPENIDHWMLQLHLNQNVVLYCVHGHEVSQRCTARLEEAGFDVAFLEGGFEQWAEENRPVASKPPGSAS
ncbi:rhodanese family chromate resistance protein ChrE [Noviherbaspirillum sp.]|uniref:rhodanese family chromate resistance protein ChrE n=1 Tax=Noviherbaspirillum sp. TaxID=1926288 RepID=UPI002FE1DD5D